jgi:hypothetical protein
MLRVFDRSQSPVRRGRDLLADALDIVARIEDPDRGVNMLENR